MTETSTDVTPEALEKFFTQVDHVITLIDGTLHGVVLRLLLRKPIDDVSITDLRTASDWLVKMRELFRAEAIRQKESQ
jgi:hypothetical protein